jgi:IrrE N-terminal-like domain
LTPEEYATILLKDLQINTLPVDPFRIAQALLIEVREVDAESFDGFYMRVGEKVLININQNISNSGRKHFTLAHEIGHHSIPTHVGNSFQCTPNPFKDKAIVEIEADQFAAELLLPTRLLKPMLHTYKPNFESIAELAEDCGTSLTATAIKFAKNTEDCCALIATSQNRIQWFQKAAGFPYWIDRGAQVSAGTLTAAYSLKGIAQEAGSEKIHASYWFSGRGIDNSTTLYESCVPMPDYGVVLTLLWFPEPPFDMEVMEKDDDYRYEESAWRWRDPDE